MHADIDDESSKPLIDILSYWQSCFWRNFFHELPIDLNTVPVPHKRIKKDLLKRELIPEENGFYWLAFYVQIEDATWPLIWIPVQILQNKLILRKEHLALPWIPNTLFLPSSAFYLDKKALYDDFLQFDCIENGDYCFKHFSHFYERCVDLVMQVMSCSARVRFDLAHTDFILIKELDLYAFGQKKISENRLVNQYTRGLENRRKETLSEKNFLNFLHRQFVDNTEVTSDESFHLALLSLLNLKPGDLQAITAPMGSMKIELIQVYVENLYCLHALDKKEKPRIALLLQTDSQERLQLYPLIDKDKLLSQCRKILNTPKINELKGVGEVIRQHMLRQYDIILKTARLARNLSILRKRNRETYQDVYLLFKEAQEERIRLDEQHSAYMAIYKAWQDRLANHSVLQKCVGWLSFVKYLRRKKAQDFLNKALAGSSLNLVSEQSLLEAIQTLEEAQQKNTQNQTQILEFLNQLKAAETTWEQWVTKLNILCDPKDLSIVGLNKLLKTPRTRMRQLTCLYWQAHRLMERVESVPLKVLSAPNNKLLMLDLLTSEDDNKYHLEQDISIEYLLINEAEQQTTSRLLPLLAMAQNAIFFGDRLAIGQSPLLSAFEDEFILKQVYQQNEEEIETLQILGAALSYANAFVLALNQSRYHPALSTCMLSQEGIKLKYIKRKQQSLFNYWNQSYHGSTLILNDPKMLMSLQPPIYFIDVHNKETGQMIGVNKLEAETILLCLQENMELQSHCVVVTPFYEQQQLLINMLSGFSIEIYNFSDLPAREYNTIIFSPVYSEHSKRPFLFDEGKSYFYSLISRAKQSFWIVGDRKIFQAYLHSASGDIAKWLDRENRVGRIEDIEIA